MHQRQFLLVGLLMAAVLPAGCDAGSIASAPTTTAAQQSSSATGADNNSYQVSNGWWHWGNHSPSQAPTKPAPSASASPSGSPSASPTQSPWHWPWGGSVGTPSTAAPSTAPSGLYPTSTPIVQPSSAPVPPPSSAPVTQPSSAPTIAPTVAPTVAPTAPPSSVPSSSPTPSTSASVNPAYDALAQQVLQLTNVQRAAAGAAPLVMDPGLETIAMARSQDMVTRNYFAHVDPSGHDVFYYMQQAGINFTTAGENIAEGQQTPQDVVNAWMSDAGHRDNMLNTQFGKLGVGIAQTAQGTYYWTQDFTN